MANDRLISIQKKIVRAKGYYTGCITTAQHNIIAGMHSKQYKKPYKFEGNYQRQQYDYCDIMTICGITTIEYCGH